MGKPLPEKVCRKGSQEKVHRKWRTGEGSRENFVWKRSTGKDPWQRSMGKGPQEKANETRSTGQGFPDIYLRNADKHNITI
jgi:hypothetical protein